MSAGLKKFELGLIIVGNNFTVLFMKFRRIREESENNGEGDNKEETGEQKNQ